MITLGRVLQKELMESDLNKLIQLLIDAASNDYESYPMILEECQKLAGASRELPNVEAIALALKEALKMDLVHAYRYSESKQSFVRQVLPTDQLKPATLLPLYFLASEKGRQLLD